MTPGDDGAVGAGDVVEDETKAPAVEDRVVGAPDELVAVVRGAGEQEPPLWDVLLGEAAGPVFRQVGVEQALLFVGALVAPVLELQRDGQAIPHELQRVAGVGRPEARAQDRVTLHHRRPGLPERLDVKVQAEPVDHLDVVDPLALGEAALEPQALLDRGLRVAVGERPPAAARLPLGPGPELVDERVELGLVEAAERQVGRGVAEHVGASRLGDEGPQHLHRALRDASDRRLLVRAGAVGPLEA